MIADGPLDKRFETMTQMASVASLAERPQARTPTRNARLGASAAIGEKTATRPETATMADVAAARLQLDALLSTLNHDLRTPLNAIIGFSELMLMGVAGPLPSKQRDYARHIRTSALVMLGRVQGLGEISATPAE